MNLTLIFLLIGLLVAVIWVASTTSVPLQMAAAPPINLNLQLVQAEQNYARTVSPYDLNVPKEYQTFSDAWTQPIQAPAFNAVYTSPTLGKTCNPM